MPFIVFEGLDGAGKSTLIKGVRSQLKALTAQSVFVQDPGSTPLGEQLRTMILTPGEDAPGPKAELLMYQAARAEMVRKKIRPALRNGQWVFSDRFYSSTLAFQVFARGLDRKIVEGLNEFVAEACHPDLFVFIDIPISEREARLQKRFSESGEKQDRMESEETAFHEKVREGYLYQAKELPQKWLVLDGTLSPAQLVEKVMSDFRSRQWL